MRNVLLKALGLSTLVLVSAIGSVWGSEIASAKADVFHVTSTHAIVPGADVDRCDGHAVDLTLFFNGPIHTTVTPSGNTHFHLVNTGRFEATSLDPAFEDESGRFTVHVTSNTGAAGDNFVFNFRIKGTSTDGSPVQWNQTARVFIDGDGELRVVFDRVVNCS